MTNGDESLGIKPSMLQTQKFHDERGFFQITWDDTLVQQVGWLPKQTNISLSHKWVIRGMHWQSHPHEQSKFLVCLQGKIIDVCVRLSTVHENPETSIFRYEMSASDPSGLVVPAGFAHGFQVLEEDTLVMYYVNANYAPDSERVFNSQSQEISKFWEKGPVIQGKRDREAHHLDQIKWE